MTATPSAGEEKAGQEKGRIHVLLDLLDHKSRLSLISQMTLVVKNKNNKSVFEIKSTPRESKDVGTFFLPTSDLSCSC